MQQVEGARVAIDLLRGEQTSFGIGGLLLAAKGSRAGYPFTGQPGIFEDLHRRGDILNQPIHRRINPFALLPDVG